MSKIIRKCVLKGQKEAIGYAWCFPMMAILKRITILKSTFQSSVSTLPLRLHCFFVFFCFFFASATYVNGNRSNCIHLLKFLF